MGKSLTKKQRKAIVALPFILLLIALQLWVLWSAYQQVAAEGIQNANFAMAIVTLELIAICAVVIITALQYAREKVRAWINRGT